VLFEGKFKSQYAEDDRYLKYLFSYIHLNPIKTIYSNWRERCTKHADNIFEFLRNYKFSSYQDYLNVDRVENIILNKENFPQYFPTPKLFEKEIIDWITYNNTEALPPGPPDVV